MSDFIELTMARVQENVAGSSVDDYKSLKNLPRKVRKTSIDAYGESLVYGNKFTDIIINGVIGVVTETTAEIDALLV